MELKLGQSEVAQILQQIEAEYIAAQRGLTGLAEGATHEAITARMAGCSTAVVILSHSNRVAFVRRKNQKENMAFLSSVYSMPCTESVLLARTTPQCSCRMDASVGW